MIQGKCYTPSTFRPLGADTPHESRLVAGWHFFWNLPVVIATGFVSPDNLVVQILTILWQLYWSLMAVLVVFGCLHKLHEEGCARFAWYSKLYLRLKAHKAIMEYVSERV